MVPVTTYSIYYIRQYVNAHQLPVILSTTSTHRVTVLGMGPLNTKPYAIYIYIYIYTASRFLRNPSAAAVSIKKQRAPCSAHVLVAVAYSRVRMSDEAVVQVHVPVVPQLLLPREILQRVHLAESTICFFNRVRREKNKLQLMRST